MPIFKPAYNDLNSRDEVKLLRDLERIISAHGLVDFRPTLAMLLDALYQSGSKAMVIVSKVDLLAQADRERTIEYIHRHLQTELHLNLQIYPLSVIGKDAYLCEHWFEHQLKPLLESHQEAARLALQRKIGSLSKAVIEGAAKDIANAWYESDNKSLNTADIFSISGIKMRSCS